MKTFAKAQKKRQHIYIHKLECATRSYEESIIPILSKISEISASVPSFWAIAIRSSPPLHDHIHPDDHTYLTHILSVNIRLRPRFADGLSLSIQLDQSFNHATLTRSFALHNPAETLLLLTKSAHYSSVSSTLKDAIENGMVHSSLKLVSTGFISFPEEYRSHLSTTEKSLNSSSLQSPHLLPSSDAASLVKTNIRKCGFFSYFLSDLDIDTAEQMVKQFLPNAVRYYAIDSQEDDYHHSTP